jgi:hypothetical protein
LSDGGIWLNYCLSTALAFIAVHYGHWRTPKAIVAAAAAAMLIWLVRSLGREGSLDDLWLSAALLINAGLCLIFGGAGALFAFLMPVRDDDDD